MDPTRDNPLIRFNTFWWALWTFLSFAVMLAAILVFKHRPPTRLEDAAAVARYVTKDKILKAEAAALSSAEIAAVIPNAAAELSSSKPAAVERPDQVVPGSPTALKLAAEPASVPATDAEPPPAGTAEPVAASGIAPASAEPAVEAAAPPAPGEAESKVEPAVPAPEKVKPKDRPTKPAPGKARH